MRRKITLSLVGLALSASVYTYIATDKPQLSPEQMAFNANESAAIAERQSGYCQNLYGGKTDHQVLQEENGTPCNISK